MSSNYAALASALGARTNLAASAKAESLVFPVMDGCVDYGSHKHLPDSI
jgi:hypothetical protein